MPNYIYYCETCDITTEEWQSIYAEARQLGSCSHPVVQVIDRVVTLGIGARGQEYQEVEAREARWHKDMPAYKRFRDRGYQPPQIDGCDKLEAIAKNELAIRSGGRLNLDEKVMREKKAMAEDIMEGRV